MLVCSIPEGRPEPEQAHNRLNSAVEPTGAQVWRALRIRRCPLGRADPGIRGALGFRHSSPLVKRLFCKRSCDDLRFCFLVLSFPAWRVFFSLITRGRHCYTPEDEGHFPHICVYQYHGSTAAQLPLPNQPLNLISATSQPGRKQGSRPASPLWHNSADEHVATCNALPAHIPCPCRRSYNCRLRIPLPPPRIGTTLSVHSLDSLPTRQILRLRAAHLPFPAV
ncbi:uncharacterized protein B0T15DRAFT_196563 [Chaetomium strumarium]|uniref:Uncharacterized protein n=1 Tax=Chaetomium strumarium TaxID=1170767 RepID=A0AAJ0M1D3_9PEZI|nr:hypothetical protein B0T15DRAFT_196563 [Chaetomium strumarium]